MTSRSLARWSWVAGRLTIAAGLVTALAGRAGAQAVHAGAHAGVVLDAAKPFSESICPDESTLLVGVHAGYDVSGLLGVEGALSLHAEHPDLCLNGLLPPGELVSEEEIPGEFSENPVLLRASVGWVVF